MLKDRIKSLAQAYKQEVIANRRHLHSHPELSFKEYETAAFVAEKLKEIGITEIESKATTGWSALIKGKNPKKRWLPFAQTWMPCQSLRQMRCRTSPKTLASCMHAVTMHTRPLFWALQKF